MVEREEIYKHLKKQLKNGTPAKKLNEKMNLPQNETLRTAVLCLTILAAAIIAGYVLGFWIILTN